MSTNKRKAAQSKIIGEVRNQLVLQAERWGRTGYYTPEKLEEMELEQCGLILSDLLSEKSNLEYELHLLGSNKHELLIKLERLANYIAKARKVAGKHEKNLKKHYEQIMKEKDKLRLIMKRLKPENTFSVLLSSN